MTRTSRMAQKMPIFSEMIEMVEKIERETYKVPFEFNIHPDDFAELRMQVGPHMLTISPNGQPTIDGLRLVMDYRAIRLQRKVAKEC